MTLYDYVARLANREDIFLVCVNRLGDCVYRGMAACFPINLATRQIIKHTIIPDVEHHLLKVKVFLT